MMLARSVNQPAGGDAPKIIAGGKFEGASFADLDLEELIALRRYPKVSRAGVEYEIWRRREAAKRRRHLRRPRFGR